MVPCSAVSLEGAAESMCARGLLEKGRVEVPSKRSVRTAQTTWAPEVNRSSSAVVEETERSPS